MLLRPGSSVSGIAAPSAGVFLRHFTKALVGCGVCLQQPAAWYNITVGRLCRGGRRSGPPRPSGTPPFPRQNARRRGIRLYTAMPVAALMNVPQPPHGP